MTFVVATAGHVDHGKSTLVRALTSMEPDRLEEERRRGLSIELGYAWTTWPGIGPVAFVDVPGHRRFVRTTLAGLGPVAVVMFVVAADEGWMPQSAEHLAALDALGVSHGVLVITKCDRADPAHASDQARLALSSTSLAGAPEVSVSANGIGVPELVTVLSTVLTELPPVDRTSPVRLWVDRSFSVTGAGQVITGTLPAGTISVGDELATADGTRVRVRGLESLGEPVDRVTGTARAAVNIRVREPGARGGVVGRGAVLVAPGTHVVTTELDVALRAQLTGRWASAVLHIGSAAVRCRVRPLGAAHARLTLAAALPLRVGDRALLRDPGRSGALIGVTVLDVRPPALTARGAASRRAGDLSGLVTPRDVAAYLLSFAPYAVGELAAMGLPVDQGVEVAPGWRVGAQRWQQLARSLRAMLAAAHDRDALAPGMPVAVVADRLGLIDATLVPPLATAAGLQVERGLVGPAAAGRGVLPAAVGAILDRLDNWFDDHPYEAPPVSHLTELGLDDRALASAARAGRVLRIGPRLVLPAGADARAYDELAHLPEPFRVTDVCTVLETTRRTAVPLLELLDRTGRTLRSADGRRTLRRVASPG